MITQNPYVKAAENECEMTEEMAALKKQMRKEEAKNEELKRKLNTRVQSTNRLKKRVKSFQGVIQRLKDQDLISSDCVNRLDTCINGLPQKLFNRICQNKDGKISRKKYPEELMSFALTLQFYSGKAYNYVRKKLSLSLPSPSHLRKLYSKIDGDPGKFLVIMLFIFIIGIIKTIEF